MEYELLAEYSIQISVLEFVDGELTINLNEKNSQYNSSVNGGSMVNPVRV